MLNSIGLAMPGLQMAFFPCLLGFFTGSVNIWKREIPQTTKRQLTNRKKARLEERERPPVRHLQAVSSSLGSPPHPLPPRGSSLWLPLHFLLPVYRGSSDQRRCESSCHRTLFPHFPSCPSTGGWGSAITSRLLSRPDISSIYNLHLSNSLHQLL